MSGLRKVTVAAVIVSMVAASTTAVAASPVAASVSAPAAASAAGSWGTLSVMTGSSAATAALQSDDDRDGGFSRPALISLAVILATIAAAIYIITKKSDKDLGFNRPTPISPN